MKNVDWFHGTAVLVVGQCYHYYHGTEARKIHYSTMYYYALHCGKSPFTIVENGLNCVLKRGDKIKSVVKWKQQIAYSLIFDVFKRNTRVKIEM